MSQTLLLRYGDIEVGVISNAFWSDNTWFGTFSETLRPASGLLEKRLHEFIAFSEGWHARGKADQSANADEWDAFGDLYGRWQTVASDGAISPIHDAPVFVEGEVTWATESDLAASK